MEKITRCELCHVQNIADAEIYVGADVIYAIPKVLNKLLPNGLVVIVCDQQSKHTAEKLAIALAKARYSIIITQADKAPSHARFVMGVGEGEVAEKTKTLASSMQIGAGILLTAPSCDTILQGGGFAQVYLDSDVLQSCPRESLAAGWGIAYAEPLRRFEDYFLQKVLGKDVCEDIPLPQTTDETDLALYLLQLSAARQQDDNATVMAKLLLDEDKNRHAQERLLGEYKFVSACVLSAFYENYLSSPSIDCMPPPSHDSKLDEISMLTNRPISDLISRLRIINADDYFKIGYILGEYRLDLLEKLKYLDLRTSQKRWRRLYADAGYWLKSRFTADSLIDALRLSAELSSGLLRYVCESGFLDNCA